MSNNKEHAEKMLQLVRAAIEHDGALREQFGVGDKFRFIRDRLQSLLAHTEASLSELEKQTEQRSDQIADDEQIVYVYLYNAHGLSFPSWQKMLAASVFYEYSVNRPIYAEKAHIEAFIRSRTNRYQHAYLSVVIKKSDISIAAGSELLKDVIGGQLLKIREGSLSLKKLSAFTHNGNEYTVTEEGQVVKKP